MTLSQVYRKLVDDKVVTFSRPYLSKLINEVKIPYTEVNGKKDFDFEEVVKGIANSKSRVKDGDSKTLNNAKIKLTEYQAKLAEQKFDVEANLLVYRDEVEQKAFTAVRVLRDQILTLPERLAGEVASSTDPKEVKEIMYKEINAVLEYLSSAEVLYD